MDRPERYRNSIVPHIYVDGASDGIAFYKRAFGAKLYGDPRALGRCTASLHIFADDNVGLQRRAIEAGAEEIQACRGSKISIRPKWNVLATRS